MLRKARIDDVKQIHSIINLSASKGEMLPRSLGELYDNIRDYFVHEEGGHVVGTCALHICWEDLSEIRSLCVVQEVRQRGVGRGLINACFEEALKFGSKKLFVLTYQVEFFEAMGFQVADKRDLPHKIWSDCIKCPKFPECDEVAMMRLLDRA
jgi:amino-acid N-acetyltransferase